MTGKLLVYGPDSTMIMWPCGTLGSTRPGGGLFPTPAEGPLWELQGLDEHSCWVFAVMSHSSSVELAWEFLGHEPDMLNAVLALRFCDLVPPGLLGWRPG